MMYSRFRVDYFKAIRGFYSKVRSVSDQIGPVQWSSVGHIYDRIT